MTVQAVDIIVLNYNNKGYIEPCIESILRSKNPSWNLIIVDQNSEDGSLEWLENKRNEHPYDIHLIKNKINTGAWGQTAIFLDSDTEIISQESLIALVTRLHFNPDCGMVEAKVKIHDGTYRFAGFAACAIKTQVFKEIGLFDKHFMIGGDQDFWAKFKWNDSWGIEFEEWTDIIHHCGRTINPKAIDQEKFSIDHKIFRQDLPRYIYTGKFLDETVGKIDRLRQAEERSRGWIK